MRGLCNGLGPALFGLFFYISHVHLEEIGGVSVPPTPSSAGPQSVPSAINATTATQVNKLFECEPEGEA